MHPILFRVGDFAVGTYGIMIVLGIIAGLAVVRYLVTRDGRDFTPYYDLAFFVLLAAFVGARVLFILVNLDAFFESPGRLIFAREGFVFLGGFAAAIGATLVGLKVKNLPIWDSGDYAAPGLAIGHGIGRIGCFLAGCCYGKPVSGPLSFLGVQFPHVHTDGETFASFAWHDHVYNGLIPPTAEASLPVYPTQLFESVGNLLIFAALMVAWRMRKFSGQIFTLYLMLYGLMRFTIEYFRGDVGRGVYLGGLLSTSQILSIIAISVGIGLWYYLRAKTHLPQGRLATSSK